MKERKKRKISLPQGCAIFLLIYAAVAVGVYYIGGEQFWYSSDQTVHGTIASNAATGKIDKDTSLVQTFVPVTNEIRSVSLVFATGGRKNPGEAVVQLLDPSNGRVLAEKRTALSALANGLPTVVSFQKLVPVEKGKLFAVKLTAPDAQSGTSISVLYDERKTFPGGGAWYLNGKRQKGVLCLNYTGRNPLSFGKNYAKIMSGFGAVLALYCLNLIWRRKKGKKSLGLNLIGAFERYRFLLHQLVSRDFKTKYKRSVLGVFWSFLNPLLSMAVQYVIFSTIFRSNIANFPVYLLIGIVFFNFFTESVGMGLSSIVGSASLITKVYIPKYIFPVSRVLSSAINLLISLIPLLLVMVITGTAFRPALLLLPFSMICTILFCFGMCFLLSTSMVFFRDTQFLWNVVSLLWMYATPIFYPETILPDKYMFVFKMNPMYHFIRFARTIIIDGVSPEPKAYLFCIVASVLPLLIGAAIFKKNQNKFILNL